MASWLGLPEQPLFDVPNPTQLNATGVEVDLIPIIKSLSLSPASVNLSDSTGVSVALFTDSVTSPAGTYSVQAGATFLDPNLITAWNTNETILCDIFSSDGASVAQNSANITMAPYYASTSPTTGNYLHITVSGIIVLAVPKTFVVRAIRQGTPSLNKVGICESFTIQRIA